MAKSHPDSTKMPPKRGDKFEFGPDDAPVKAIVTRVSVTGRWADLACRGPGGWSWGERFYLPLAADFRPIQ